MLLALAAGLLLVVAVGTRGSPTGGIPVPSTEAIWETAAYALVGLLAGIGMVALPIALVLGRRRGSLHPRSTRRRVTALAAIWLALFGGLFLYAQLAHHPQGIANSVPPPLRVPGGGLSPPPPAPAHGATAGSSVVLIALLVGIALGVVVALVVFAGPRGRPAASPITLDPEPTAPLDMVDAAIGALGSEADPRRAVIAAYATMERLLAAAGTPRRAADAPTEHLERSLVHLGAARSSARRLTDLFEKARFSVHLIDEPVRQAALEALAVVRRDLERLPQMAR